jgi:hypothetical protein
MKEEGRTNDKSRWRKWGGYALGIVIESTAVIGISLLALLVMLIIKVIMT